MSQQCIMGQGKLVMVLVQLTFMKQLYNSDYYYAKMGNSRKYPYPTMDGFHVLTPPCLRKFQTALPPHAHRIP